MTYWLTLPVTKASRASLAAVAHDDQIKMPFFCDTGNHLARKADMNFSGVGDGFRNFLFQFRNEFFPFSLDGRIELREIMTLLVA